MIFQKNRPMMNKIWLKSTTNLHSLTLPHPFKTMITNNTIDWILKIYPLCCFLTPQKATSFAERFTNLFAFISKPPDFPKFFKIYICVPLERENPLGLPKKNEGCSQVHNSHLIYNSPGKVRDRVTFYSHWVYDGCDD